MNNTICEYYIWIYMDILERSICFDRKNIARKFSNEL